MIKIEHAKETVRQGQIVMLKVGDRFFSGRIEKCMENGVFVEYGLHSYDNIYEADSAQVDTVCKLDRQCAQMLDNGDNLMNNLVEPEFI